MATHPKRKIGKKIPRRIPKRLTKLAKPHALRLGYIVWASNWLQGGLYQIMQYLMRDIHLEITRAIWHSHKSDIGQREMLAAVTHQTLREDHPSHDEILWIVSEAGYLSGKRNDFVHTPMAYLHDERGVSLIPHPFEAEERRIHRLEKIMSTDGASHHLRNDYYALGNYAREISAWLGRREQDSNPPLPQRPILLAAKLLGDDRQTTRRRSSARQKPQPRSSRPKV